MELTLEQIQSKYDVLLKSYWLFVYGKTRTGVWEDLFKIHLDKYYPANPDYIIINPELENKLVRGSFYKIEGGALAGVYRALVTMDYVPTDKWELSKRGDVSLNNSTVFRSIASIRNSKRTNFPRVMWQKDELSWTSYYEGLILLSSIYSSMSVELELVYRGKELHKYTLPVDWDLFETTEGTNLKPKGRVDNSLVVSNDLNRANEQGLSIVLRNVIRRHKITRSDLDKLLDNYISNPENIHTFSTKSVPNIKSSILGTMYKWCSSWSNFTRAIKILEYTDLSITIVGVKNVRGKEEKVTTSVNMRLD